MSGCYSTAAGTSIQTSDPWRVTCYDIRLSAAQREDAKRRRNLLVLDLPNDPLIGALIEATRDATPLPKLGTRIWPLWICPLLIRAVPLRDVFWIDCDAVMLRGLDELFAMLGDGPVFTPENKAPQATPNKPSVEQQQHQGDGEGYLVEPPGSGPNEDHRVAFLRSPGPPLCLRGTGEPSPTACAALTASLALGPLSRPSRPSHGRTR